VTKTFSHDNKKRLNSTNFVQHMYKWLNKWLIWLSAKKQLVTHIQMTK